MATLFLFTRIIFLFFGVLYAGVAFWNLGGGSSPFHRGRDKKLRGPLLQRKMNEAMRDLLE